MEKRLNAFFYVYFISLRCMSVIARVWATRTMLVHTHFGQVLALSAFEMQRMRAIKKPLSLRAAASLKAGGAQALGRKPSTDR